MQMRPFDNLLCAPLTLLFAIAVMFLFTYDSHGDYTITGTAAFGPFGPKFPTMRFNLTLESREPEYRITALPIDGEWYDNQVSSGNGTDNFVLDQTWPSWDARKSNAGYQEAGTVADGAFPVNSLSIVQLLWLAYCSSSNLHNGTNNLSIPLRCAKYAPADNLTEIVSYTDSGSTTLSRIQCFAPGYLLALRDGSKIDLKPPYDNGYLLWQIVVTGFTNVGQLTIPAGFQYTQFYPKVAGGTNSLDLRCIMKCEFELANCLDSVASQSLLPKTTVGSVRVFDWRFNKIKVTMDGSREKGTPVATYTINDSNWRGRDDPGIKGEVIAIREVVHDASPARVNPAAKVSFYSLFISITLLLGWFIKREVNKKAVNRNNI